MVRFTSISLLGALVAAANAQITTSFPTVHTTWGDGPAPSTTADPRPSVVSLILPTGIPIPTEASIVASDAAKTTYALDIVCGSDMNAAECELVNEVDSITIIQGPKTYSESLSLSGAEIMGNCDLTGTTRAHCTAAINYPDLDIHTTETFVLGEDELTFFPVTVTAWPGDNPEETVEPNAAVPMAAGTRWAVGSIAVALVMAAF